MQKIPRVFRVTKHIVVGVNSLAPLGHVGTDEGDEAHLPDHVYMMAVSFRQRIYFGNEATVNLPIPGDKSFLQTRRHSIKRRVAPLCGSMAPPAPLVPTVSLPLLITGGRLFNGFLEHLVQHIVIADAYGRHPLDEDIQYLKRSSLPLVHHVCEGDGGCLPDQPLFFGGDLIECGRICGEGISHSLVEIVADGGRLLKGELLA